VGQLLGLGRWETDAFLKERGVFLSFSPDDLERDYEAAERAARS